VMLHGIIDTLNDIIINIIHLNIKINS
jgi:hypothetical protein